MSCWSLGALGDSGSFDTDAVDPLCQGGAVDKLEAPEVGGQAVSPHHGDDPVCVSPSRFAVSSTSRAWRRFTGAGKKCEALMSELSDEAIMARVQGGETGLLDLLVRRYEKPLYGFAFRLLAERTAAEDAFQETFLRVLRKRASYRIGCPLRPWLYQICLNACRDALRKRARRPETELPERLALADPAPGPEALSAQSALAERVRQAVAALPEKHREVFLLHHYQGLAYPEIADILSIPLGTVKSRMFHASQKLSLALQDLRGS
jgi:RNA polymerase sigma-70 factor (ECF subfamily)